MREILPGILLLYSSYTDVKRREISGLWLCIFGVLGLFCQIFGRSITLFQCLLGVLIGIILICVSIMTKGKLGFGDGLLLCITGLFLGFNSNALLIMGAVFLSAIFSVLLALKSAIKDSIGLKHAMNIEFPFVPFLFITYVFMLIFNK